jgi:Flp pilus assembly protein TadD
MATVEEVFGLAIQKHSAGDLHQAEQLYRQILQSDPNHAGSLHYLGVVAYATGHYEDAIDWITRSLILNRNNATGYYHLGTACECQGRLEEAIDYQREAIRLNPNFHEAWNNLGLALKRQRKLQEAADSYRQALRLNPGYAPAHNNLGVVLQEQGNLTEVLNSFDQALRLEPGFSAAHWNRALLLLLLGDWEQGWREYEWRWTQPGFVDRKFRQPLWNGSDLAGKAILLHAEQAAGDTFQFIRYAPLVKQRGGNVIVECQPPLIKLLASAKGIDCLLARGAPLPAFDVHAALTSLPGIFRTTPSSVPATGPYLQADPGLVDYWEHQLANLRSPKSQTGSNKKDFLVGIVWQGNPNYENDRWRSFPLALFSRLAQLEGVRLISLQKGLGTEQLEAWPGPNPPVSFGPQLDETAGAFMDTAAIMMGLDLVISSDTAVPHLAGALGVPVWVALPLVPDWRWLLQTDKSAWYPKMRLFRQTRLGQWDDVFARIAEELKKAIVNAPPINRT